MSEEETKQRKRLRALNNLTTTGYRISDELWAVLQPLLPVHINTHRFGGGRPRVSDRCCADAIFYVLRTGCQWQALDQTELCAHSTAHDRFQAWVEAGVFLVLWQTGVEQFDEAHGLNWDWLSMDGAMAKAPLGEEKTGPNPTDRGKSGVKRSVLTDGQGIPIAVEIEGANRHDMKLTRPTIAGIVTGLNQQRQSRKGCAWIKDMITRRYATSSTTSALPPIFVFVEKKPRQSKGKPGSKRVGG